MSDSTPRTPGNEAPAAAADSPVEPSVVEPSTGAVDVERQRRTSAAIAMNRGFGDAMGRGLELALTLVVFGAIGWGIDRLAGTSPIFTLAFSAVGFAGISVKLWLGYDLEMRKHEAEGVWNRPTDGTRAANLAGHGPTDAPKQTIEL